MRLPHALWCGNPEGVTQMSSDRLRIGVIGAGGFFDKRAAGPLADAANVDLHSVMVRDQHRADALACKHGARRAYATVDELLADPDVDAVYIVTPVHTHLAITRAAAHAGKHVLCEKPMALSTAECREMIEACAHADVKLMVAFMSRFHPPYRALRDRIRAGDLGQVVAFRGRWGFYYPPSPSLWRQALELAGGGPLMDVGSHAIDCLRFWLGEVAEVAAFSDTLAFDYPVEDTCNVLLKFESGVQGSLESHFSVRNAPNGFELLGTGGIAVVPHVTMNEPTEIRTTAGTNRVAAESTDRYTAMFEHFAQACLHGEAPGVTGEDGLRNMAVIEAVYQSSRERRFVKPEAV